MQGSQGGGSSLGCLQSLSRAEKDTLSVYSYVWEGVSECSFAFGDQIVRGQGGL